MENDTNIQPFGTVSNARTYLSKLGKFTSSEMFLTKVLCRGIVAIGYLPPTEKNLAPLSKGSHKFVSPALARSMGMNPNSQI